MYLQEGSSGKHRYVAFNKYIIRHQHEKISWAVLGFYDKLWLKNN